MDAKAKLGLHVEVDLGSTGSLVEAGVVSVAGHREPAFCMPSTETGVRKGLFQRMVNLSPGKFSGVHCFFNCEISHTYQSAGMELSRPAQRPSATGSY